MDSERTSQSEPPTQSYGADVGCDSATPKDLRVRIAEQRLTILWKDGKESDYSLGELRRRCPCAACRADRESQNTDPLRILKSDPTDIRVTHAELVGNYAIRFRWSDGHDAGIFDFRLLRSNGPS